MVLDGKEQKRVVAPAERATAPRGPWHQLNGVHANRQQVVEPVEHGVHGGPLTPERVREVVEHQLVDHELLLRARVGQRTHGEPLPADDEARVLVRPPDIPGARIGAPAARPVLEIDEVLVLVEPLREPPHTVGEEPVGRVLARGSAGADAESQRRSWKSPTTRTSAIRAGPPRSY